MKPPSSFKKRPISFLGLLLFLSTIGITIFVGMREFKRERIKPTELVIANITTTQGEIYWKSKEEEVYTVTYTQNSYDTVEQTLDSVLIAKDSITGKYIYSAKITNLNPDTEYLFNIKTDKFSWDQITHLKTRATTKVLNLPKFVQGESQPRQLVLIKTDNGNYIKNTQEHGTWLIEQSTQDYSLITYATYTLKNNAKKESNTKFDFSPSPTYAQNNSTTIDPDNVTTLKLERGTNFIQIPIFLDKQSRKIFSARELIQFSDNTILSIGLFRNDTWEEIVINENGKIYGEDFNLIAGEAYMFITKENIHLQVIEGAYSPDLNVDNFKGWNLVPASIFNYSSLTTRDILQDEDYLSITQTALWNNNRCSFEYTIENTSSAILGETIPLSIQKGLFVKIPY